MRAESGIETLRKLVNIAGWSMEWALDDFDVKETINILLACQSLDLETLPDHLKDSERKYAAKHGRVSLKCLERLYRAEYGPGFAREGLDWENKVWEKRT